MRVNAKKMTMLMAVAAIGAVPAGVAAQVQKPEAPPADLTASVSAPAPAADLAEGPKVEGIISARQGDRLQVTGADGSRTAVTVTDATQIRASTGLFGLGRSKLTPSQLMNGLPVEVHTAQGGGDLIATEISLKNKDIKTAAMIQGGTAQGFAEQTAATEALRGRVADIGQYNVKSTTNVNFDTGKAVLSPQAKADLCAAAQSADAMDNALLLVVGYTDSTGPDELNQTLSEKRAGRVVNYLQQACKWKPYRMLTPTGMAEADPTADNTTEEGKAMNRRVAVNVLVSKGLDGM